jgi:hypothetical protein
MQSVGVRVSDGWGAVWGQPLDGLRVVGCMKTSTVSASTAGARSKANARAVAVLIAVPVAMGLSGCVESATVPAGYVSNGFYQTAYPRMVPVPGYPVYYDPYASANYFFYDGSYWLYQYDNWYSSSGYNGPWGLVRPAYVPYYLLRVPVRYYRAPPPYFRGWHADAAPHWGEHWGRTWEQQHPDWNRWDHRTVPPAPLPAYRRDDSGDHGQRDREQQQPSRDVNDRYEPHEDVARSPDRPAVRPPGAEPHQDAPQPVARAWLHQPPHQEAPAAPGVRLGLPRPPATSQPSHEPPPQPAPDSPSGAGLDAGSAAPKHRSRELPRSEETAPAGRAVLHVQQP